MLDHSETVTQQNSHQALSMLRMLWKRRWLTFSFWLVASALAIPLVQLLPPVYRAEAVVLVDSQKIPETLVSPTVSGDVADRLALISQNIMTSTRLLEIINAFHLYRDEKRHLTQEELLDKMRQDISVNFEKSWTGDRMHAFRLGYEGKDAETVAEVTNRLAGLYVAENMRAREDQAQGTVDFLRRQLQEARTSLDEQEQKVAQFKQDHNGALPEQQTSLLGTLSSLSVELQGVQTSIDRVQEKKMSLEAALSAAESTEASLRASLRRELKGSGQILTDSGKVLRPKSEILRDQLRALRLRYTPNHPEVQTVEKELAQAERDEAEQANTMSGHASDSTAGPSSKPADPSLEITSPELLGLKERIATLRAQIPAAKHELEFLEKQRQELTASITDCQARINKLPLVEQEMAGLKRNYEESANNYNSLLQKKMAAGIATDMERSQKSERFTVIDPARTPQKPEKSKRLIVGIGGSIVGLILGLLLGFMLEFRRHAFLGEWELPAGTVVLGRIPPIQPAASVGKARSGIAAAGVLIGVWLLPVLIALWSSTQA
jgi:polysaccharide chain length determinant protein (PEP-CTERM system associated)